MERKTFSVLTYNCNSASIHKRQYIKYVIDHYEPEFVCLQETWLLSHAIKSTLSEIDNSYVPHGVSGNDERGDVICGRPKGGCAILWHKSVSQSD